MAENPWDQFAAVNDPAPEPEPTPQGMDLDTIIGLENSAAYAKRNRIPLHRVVSSAGAIGEMQIMPGTARQYGYDPEKLYDPAYNRMVGQKILDDLNKRYNNDREAVAIAYNAGPGRANRFLRRDRDESFLPAETRGYLDRLRKYKPPQQDFSQFKEAPKDLAGEGMSKPGPDRTWGQAAKDWMDAAGSVVYNLPSDVGQGALRGFETIGRTAHALVDDDFQERAARGDFNPTKPNKLDEPAKWADPSDIYARKGIVGLASSAPSLLAAIGLGSLAGSGVGTGMMLPLASRLPQAAQVLGSSLGFGAGSAAQSYGDLAISDPETAARRTGIEAGLGAAQGALLGFPSAGGFATRLAKQIPMQTAGVMGMDPARRLLNNDPARTWDEFYDVAPQEAMMGAGFGVLGALHQARRAPKLPDFTPPPPAPPKRGPDAPYEPPPDVNPFSAEGAFPLDEAVDAMKNGYRNTSKPDLNPEGTEPSGSMFGTDNEGFMDQFGYPTDQGRRTERTPRTPIDGNFENEIPTPLTPPGFKQREPYMAPEHEAILGESASKDMQATGGEDWNQFQRWELPADMENPVARPREPNVAHDQPDMGAEDNVYWLASDRANPLEATAEAGFQPSIPHDAVFPSLGQKRFPRDDSTSTIPLEPQGGLTNPWDIFDRVETPTDRKGPPDEPGGGGGITPQPAPPKPSAPSGGQASRAVAPKAEPKTARPTDEIGRLRKKLDDALVERNAAEGALEAAKKELNYDQTLAMKKTKKRDDQLDKINKRLDPLRKELQDANDNWLKATDKVLKANGEKPVAVQKDEVATLSDDIAKVEAKTPSLMAYGKSEMSEARTPGDIRVPVMYTAVRLDSLIASHNPDSSLNDVFPQALQPRDRTKKSTALQIANIIGKFNPPELMRSAVAGTGAPIVDGYGVVEVGNGRVMALRQIREKHPELWANYQKAMADAGFGTGNPEEVLVRVRTNEMTPLERAAFARDANGKIAAGMTPGEEARADSRMLSDDVLDNYKGGSLRLVQNRDFVRDVVKSIATSPSEVGDLLRDDGLLHDAGEKRVEQALLMKAFPEDTKLIENLIDAADQQDLKAVGDALRDIAPAWAQMRADVRAGRIPADLDATEPLLIAVRKLQRSRREKTKMLRVLNDNDMFAGFVDDRTKVWASFLFKDQNLEQPKGYIKLKDDLTFYTEEARKQTTDPNQGDMIGGARKNETESEILGKRLGAGPAVERPGQQDTSAQYDLYRQKPPVLADRGEDGTPVESTQAGRDANEAESFDEEVEVTGPPKRDGNAWPHVDPQEWPEFGSVILESKKGVSLRFARPTTVMQNGDFRVGVYSDPNLLDVNYVIMDTRTGEMSDAYVGEDAAMRGVAEWENETAADTAEQALSERDSLLLEQSQINYRLEMAQRNIDDFNKMIGEKSVMMARAKGNGRKQQLANEIAKDETIRDESIENLDNLKKRQAELKWYFENELDAPPDNAKLSVGRTKVGTKKPLEQYVLVDEGLMTEAEMKRWAVAAARKRQGWAISAEQADLIKKVDRLSSQRWRNSTPFEKRQAMAKVYNARTAKRFAGVKIKLTPEEQAEKEFNMKARSVHVAHKRRTGATSWMVDDGHMTPEQYELAKETWRKKYHGLEPTKEEEAAAAIYRRLSNIGPNGVEAAREKWRLASHTRYQKKKAVLATKESRSRDDTVDPKVRIPNALERDTSFDAEIIARNQPQERRAKGERPTGENLRNKDARARHFTQLVGPDLNIAEEMYNSQLSKPDGKIDWTRRRVPREQRRRQYWVDDAGNDVMREEHVVSELSNENHANKIQELQVFTKSASFSNFGDTAKFPWKQSIAYRIVDASGRNVSSPMFRKLRNAEVYLGEVEAGRQKLIDKTTLPMRSWDTHDPMLKGPRGYETQTHPERGFDYSILPDNSGPDIFGDANKSEFQRMHDEFNASLKNDPDWRQKFKPPTLPEFERLVKQIREEFNRLAPAGYTLRPGEGWINGQNKLVMGFHDPRWKVIAYSVNIPDPYGTFRHEVFHSVWDRLSEPEKRAVYKAALDKGGEGLNRWDINRRYAHVNLDGRVQEFGAEEFMAHRRDAKQVGKGPDIVRSSPLPPILQKAFDRVSKSFDKLGNYIRDLFGVRDSNVELTAEDVYQLIESGIVGKRPLVVDPTKPTDNEILRSLGPKVISDVNDTLTGMGLPTLRTHPVSSQVQLSIGPSVQDASGNGAGGSLREKLHWYDLSRMGKADYWRIKTQDKELRIRRIGELVARARKRMLAPAEDTSLAATTYHSIVGNKLREFDDRIVRDLVNVVAKQGLRLDQLNDYIQARAAPDRNRNMAEINPPKYDEKTGKLKHRGMPDGGSGMTNDEAAAIIEKERLSGNLNKLNKAAEVLYKVQDDTRKNLLESGLVPQQILDQWDTKEPWHVPFRGFSRALDIFGDDPEHVRSGSGFDVRGSGLKRALGRAGNRAGDSVSYILAEHEQSIIRGEKNKATITLGQMIQNNADLLGLKRVEDKQGLTLRYVPKVDEAGRSAEVLFELDALPIKRTLVTKYRLDEDAVTGEEVRTPYQEVAWRHDPLDRMRDEDTVGYTTNGVVHYIKMHDPLMARAMKNLSAQHMNEFVRAAQSVQSFLGSMFTRWNPAFSLPNLIKDSITAPLNLMGMEDIPNIHLQVMARVPMAVVEGYRAIRFGKNDTKMQKYAHEMVKYGGRVEFFGLEDIETKQRRLQREMSMANPGTINGARRLAKHLTSFISDINNAIENATRLAVYSSMRDARPDADPKYAAKAALEATVNFYRKGEWAPYVNSIYLFANANIQGNVNLLRSLYKSPTARAIVTGGVVLGIMMDQMNALLSPQNESGEQKWDSEITDWTKDHNLVFSNPDPDSIFTALKFPLPYGYNIFPAMGQRIGQYMRGVPGKTALGVAAQTIASTLDAFLPIGQGSQTFESVPGFVRSISPTIIQPIVDVGVNMDFTGRPIQKPKSEYNQPIPESQRGFKNIGPVAKWVTHELNKITGGSDLRSGWMDLSPAMIDHIFGFYTGGLGNVIKQGIELPINIASGDKDMMSPRTWPIINRFIEGKNQWYLNQKFFGVRDALEITKDELSSLRTNPDPDLINRLKADYMPEIRSIPIFNAAEKMMAPLYKARAQVMLSNRPDKEELKEKIEERIRFIQTRALTYYNGQLHSK